VEALEVEVGRHTVAGMEGRHASRVEEEEWRWAVVKPAGCEEVEEPEGSFVDG